MACLCNDPKEAYTGTAVGVGTCDVKCPDDMYWLPNQERCKCHDGTEYGLSAACDWTDSVNYDNGPCCVPNCDEGHIWNKQEQHCYPEYLPSGDYYDSYYGTYYCSDETAAYDIETDHCVVSIVYVSTAYYFKGVMGKLEHIGITAIKVVNVTANTIRL